jgi:D-alanyl-D-alanine carboxypeptidase/D-alanyl-D-alanine-endopeptidase (penicillin-binding protein 4)
VRSGNVPSAASLLAQHESPPLADAVRDINKFSNNVMARQVFLTLGNDTAPATAERARQRIADWLNAATCALPNWNSKTVPACRAASGSAPTA